MSSISVEFFFILCIKLDNRNTFLFAAFELEQSSEMMPRDDVDLNDVVLVAS